MLVVLTVDTGTSSTYEVLDLEWQEIDLAGRYLHDHDRPTGATCLIQEQAVPVCN
jgi:hypothetical protein